jgi:hypothetical protein
MNISKIFSLALIIAGIGLAIGMPRNLVSQVGAISDNAQETCPNTGGGWEKVDGLSGLTYTFTSIPSGFQVTDNCMKVGSHDPLYSTGATVTNSTLFNHSNCTAVGVPDQRCNLQNISHASFKLERIPAPSDRPSMWSDVSCGKVDITFNNPTRYFFSGDYRIDNEAGTDDQYTNTQIQNGPHAGKYFGQRFNIVDLLAGQTVVKNLTFGEDTGIHNVAYRIFRGAENDWYLDWEEVQVESDCEPNEEPTPTPTPSSDDVLSQLSTVDPSCDSDEVKASHRIKINNVDQKNIGVLFRYNGEEKKALTGDDGWAHVSFKYTGDAWVDSQPDGLPSAANFITKETDCGDVLGTSTEGQVLGATSYASTGVAQDVMMSILGLAGIGMFASGSVLHVKNKS